VVISSKVHIKQKLSPDQVAELAKQISACPRGSGRKIHLLRVSEHVEEYYEKVIDPKDPNQSKDSPWQLVQRILK
jgi:hypothetical protein